ncbi:hypothetical protein Poli38472_007643 [Pythium oligandrum]|uniref:Uncharacterized protein n=1 Tax=Pythium oligandrum TaxID=41045 RepID=A0A8K1CQI5_PYTOL|nr:hypothetical protein Poli38472_007643 [Pythium oligandrum]|eukprot:TMW67971.1 hypothetical protein Poli38472_007643 [Pythium oligandrum]
MEPRSTKRQRMDDLIEKSMALARHQYVGGGAGGVSVMAASRNTHTNEELRGGMATMPARKGTWTKEEDARLRALVGRYGRNWAVIAQSLPNRDRKRCRERYINHLDPELAWRQWTTEEDKTLEQLYGKLGSQWSRIAKQLTGRSPDDVKNRCFQLRPQQQPQDEGAESTTQRRSSHAWTHAEAEKLRAVVGAHGAKDWFFIASQLPGRTDLQCRQHWFRVLQPSITKGRGSWTPEEDKILCERVKTIGTKWTEIAQDLPGRLGKQCRDRYMNHIDPSIRKVPSRSCMPVIRMY